MSYCNISSSQQDFFNKKKQLSKNCTTKGFKTKSGYRPRCWDCDCPIHGEDILKRRYNKGVTKIENKEVNDCCRPWICTIYDDTPDVELVHLKDCVNDIFNKFSGKERGVKLYVEHNVVGNRHLNVCLGHQKLRGNYTQTDNTNIISSHRRGRKVKYDETWLNMAMMSLDCWCLKKVTKGYKKHQNDMSGWLYYCMRQEYCSDFGPVGEKVKGCTGNSFRQRRRK